MRVNMKYSPLASRPSSVQRGNTEDLHWEHSLDSLYSCLRVGCKIDGHAHS